MDSSSIFASTLGLASPWKITRVDIAQDEPRLDIFISCKLTWSMPCPVCGEESEICGSTEQAWRHEDFFHKKAVLHVTTPQINCRSRCGCLTVNVPWSQGGSRFVLIDST